MIKIIMADDHPLVRAGLKHLLSDSPDMELAAEVDDGFSLLNQVREQTFDIILLDLFMPGKSGIDLIKQLKSERPRTPILVLSTHKEDIYALRTLKAGASGYMCKDYAGSSLIDAIRKVAGGGRYISPAVAELLAEELNSPRPSALPHTLLSDREYQVFLLTAEGKGSTAIAEQLNLSIKTISTHKARIKDKMKLESNTEMLRYAIRHGLIEDDPDTPDNGVYADQ